MRDYVRHNYFDPYSLRDVEIGTPEQGYIRYANALGVGHNNLGWLVCFQVNAKNRMGGYIGLKRVAYLIRDGAVVDSLDDSATCQNRPLEPWPEMEMAGANKT